MKKGIKAPNGYLVKMDPKWFCFRCIGENGKPFKTWDTEPDGLNLKLDPDIKSFKRVGKITTESSNNIGDK